jgi:hypothetical protein
MFSCARLSTDSALAGGYAFSSPRFWYRLPLASGPALGSAALSQRMASVAGDLVQANRGFSDLLYDLNAVTSLVAGDWDVLYESFAPTCLGPSSQLIAAVYTPSAALEPETIELRPMAFASWVALWRTVSNPS